MQHLFRSESFFRLKKNRFISPFKTRVMIVCGLFLLAACAGRSEVKSASRAPFHSPHSPSQSTDARAGCESNNLIARFDLPRCRLETKKFRFEGRVALSNGENSGAVNLSWQQEGEFFDIELRIPFSGQIFHLSGDAHTAMLDGIEENTLMDSDPENLLLRHTGLTLPVRAIGNWVRGVRHAEAANVVVDAGGTLRFIEELGWRIDYRYFEQQSITTGRFAMPTNLLAQNGTTKIKLIINKWEY